MNKTEIFLNWWKERNSRPGFYGTATVDDITVKVHKGVYSPDPACTHASSLLTHILNDFIGKTVLDIGTGTGFLAIYAAKKGAKKVTAVDIQPESIENAIENVRAFGLSDIIEVFLSDVFEQVKGKYDVIIANLPFMDPEWTELNQIAIETNGRFFAELESHLEPQGRDAVQSRISRSFSGPRAGRRRFRSPGQDQSRDQDRREDARGGGNAGVFRRPNGSE